MSSYSSEFKSAIVGKLLGPKPPSVAELSKKIGIAQPTLYSWLKIARSSEPLDIPKRIKRVSNWSKKEKLKALLDTSNMSEEQLNAFCRKNGLYAPQLEQWKTELMDELGDKGSQQQKASQIKALETEVNQLKKELLRKDKALAEASAVIFLKKKAQELWGDPEDEE
jgi:transposase